MDNSKLSKALTGLALQQKYLQRQIAILGRKKTTKRDPYDVLHTVLRHLYCVGDAGRFSGVFSCFIAAEMDSHFAQDFDLWPFVEGCILLHSDLTGDMSLAQRIRDKGFVPERLDGLLLNLHSKNLKIEFGEFEKGHRLPKDTILRRYQSLIEECLLIIPFKKRGSVGSRRDMKTRLERYRQLFVTGEDSFDQTDEQFLAALKRVSEDLL